MAFTVVVKAEAQEDIIIAFNYYEDKQQNLGTQFLDSLGKRYSDLSLHPYNYAFIDEDPLKILRDVRLKGFPYAIVFEISDDTVIIYAVHHFKKNPGKKLRLTGK